MDVTAESIRSVQFREKVRGYHPADVDAFVAAVAKAVEDLERRVKELTSRLAELESRSSGSSEAEDSLRRTLVLAQRTADAAVQEAREEAARLMATATSEHEAAQVELKDLRERTRAEAEEEGRAVRESLEAQRAALQGDVDELEAHLGRERERLRIYFSDQLRRVEGGEPGLAPSPAMQAPEHPVQAADEAGPEEFETSAPSLDEESGDDDPFLAELRRAVNDEQPLGPRDSEVQPDDQPRDDPDFDRFVRADDDRGRFGSRMRRRR